MAVEMAPVPALVLVLALMLVPAMVLVPTLVPARVLALALVLVLVLVLVAGMRTMAAMVVARTPVLMPVLALVLALVPSPARVREPVVLLLALVPLLALVLVVALALALVLVVTPVLGPVLKALVRALVRGWVPERAPSQQMAAATDAREASAKSKSATWSNTAAAEVRSVRRRASTCVPGAWRSARRSLRSEHTCDNRDVAREAHPSLCTWHSWGCTTSRAASVAIRHNIRNSTSVPAGWLGVARHGENMEGGHQCIAATPSRMRSDNDNIDWGWLRALLETTPPRPQAAPPQPAGWHSRYRMW